MTQQRRQLVLLGVLGVLILWWGGNRLLDGSGGGDAGITAGGGAGELPRMVRLDHQALEPEEGKFEPGRDIFRYGQTGPSPEELRRQQAARQREQSRREPKPEPKPPTSSEPQPPPVTLAFLGTFGPREEPIAVFVDDEMIYNARQGDVIEEKFIVRQIGLESVDLGFVGFPEDVTERLGVGS